jgi:hypothetical protein
MRKYNDYPIQECADAMEAYLKKNPGARFLQKWTCGKCGERVTGNTPNRFFTSGRHEERVDGSPCGHVTDIHKSGCNYMVLQGFGGSDPTAAIDSMLRDLKNTPKAQ